MIEAKNLTIYLLTLLNDRERATNIDLIAHKVNQEWQWPEQPTAPEKSELRGVDLVPAVTYNGQELFAGTGCATCHTGEDENPGAKAVRDYVSENKPIPWKKIYNVPDHVYFSHRRHVALAKLDCAVCHGDMSKAEAPVTRQAVKITMERCVDCHDKMKVTNDCLACHR